jgi:hypothetical protein
LQCRSYCCDSVIADTIVAISPAFQCSRQRYYYLNEIASNLKESEYSMDRGGFEDWSKLAQSEKTNNLGSFVKSFTKEMLAHSAAASQVRDNGYSSVGNDTTMAIASDLRYSKSKHGNCSMNSCADTLIFRLDIADSYQTSYLRLNGKTRIRRT